MLPCRQLHFRDSETTYAECTERLTATSNPTIDDFTTWAGDAWKTPQGSFASVERWRVKAREELDELRQALLSHDVSPHDESLRATLDEAGDMLFCIAAIAVNGGVDVADSLKHTIADYLRGITYYERGEAVAVPWADAAHALLHPARPLTADSVDELFSAGFHTFASTRMNIFDPDDAGSEFLPDLVEDLSLMTGLLIGMHQRQFGYGWVQQAADAPELTGDGTPVHEALSQLYPRCFLLAVEVICSVAPGSLGAVIRHTVNKVSQRVSAGLIDKSDGSRGDLL